MLCINLNLWTVEIELDAKSMLDLITKEFNNNLYHISFIMDSKTLINQISQKYDKRTFMWY